MKRKKLFILMTATTAALALTLTACGSGVQEAVSEAVSEAESEIVSSVLAEYAGQTVTGVVSAIEDNVITLDLSQTVTDADSSFSAGQGGTPPEMSEGDGQDSNGGPGNGETPPEKPDGDSGSAPSGDDGGTPPEKPDGDSGSAPSDNGADASQDNSDSASSADNSSDASEAADAGSSEDSTDDINELPDEVKAVLNDIENSESAESAVTITIDVTVSDDTVLQNSDGDAITISDIAEGDVLSVSIDDDLIPTTIVREDNKTADTGSSGPGGQGAPEGQGGPGGGSSGTDITYTAVNEYTEDAELTGGEAVTSTGTDEEAILISDGATVSMDGVLVNRSSSDSTGGDNSSFYGVGAAILNTNGTAYIDKTTVITDAKGGAGIFSYGDGVTYVNDTTITTEQDTSGGIHAAGGGTLYAWDCTAETNGGSSAAIRSDRGGGTMVVDGGSYTSNGSGSPAVYCTADIAINDAELTATGSEAVCIEGLNTLRLFDCDLTGNIPTDDQNDVDWNVILYQSMSGDSEVGNSTFEMSGGSITAKNGGMFYTTNTESTFYLNDVELNYADDNPFFLQVTGNTNARGWGSSGSNGAQCIFTADDQDIIGDIVYDSISSVDFYLMNGSTLEGAWIDDETWAGDGGDEDASLTISGDSIWVVTGDSFVTNLYNEGKIVDGAGNTVSIIGSDGTTIVEGDSDFEVTVENYSESADFSNAYTGTSFDDYAVENPF